MTTSESRKLTDEYLSFAEDEYKLGNMASSVYYKVLIQISAEYLVEHGDEEACLRTLNRIDPDYIQNGLPQAMNDDGFLAASVVEFAYHLERRGITFEGVVRPTQSQGTA